MRGRLAAAWLVLVGGMAAAEPCPGNPEALGVSRELAVSAAEYSRLGLIQYRQTLPLRDREVVLTFDDGPLPPYTDHVLEILRGECVKATFFLIGRNARAYPQAVRRIHDLGHTVGTHSQNHPLSFDRMASEQAAHEIDAGIASVAAALGEGRTLAPFFRIPGLLRSPSIEATLAARSLVVWSADANADDWRRITAQEVLGNALRRLEERGKGMILLHDIQPRTVLMLPALLAALKARGFKVVHVVPEGALPVPAEAMLAAADVEKPPWPRTLKPKRPVAAADRGSQVASAAELHGAQ